MARNGSTRHELTVAVMRRKESLWGSGDRPFNPQRSAQNIIKNPKTGDAPSIELLQWAANATDAELYAVIATDDDYGFLFYK